MRQSRPADFKPPIPPIAKINLRNWRNWRLNDLRNFDVALQSIHQRLHLTGGEVYDSAPGGNPMKFAVRGLLNLSAALLLVSAPLSAHHEITAKFDGKKPVTLKGLVTKVDWANPHVPIFINVPDGTSIRNWAVEL